MKKIIVLLIVICLRMQAQNYGIELGIECGPGLSAFSGTKTVFAGGPEHLTNAAAISLQFNMGRHLSMRICPGYEKKGDTGSFMTTDPNGVKSARTNFRSDLSYVVFPCMLRAGFGKKVRFIMDAGFYFAYLQKAEFVIEASPVSKEFRQDITNEVNSGDGGLILGTGLCVPIGKHFSIGLEAKGNVGLADLQWIFGFSQISNLSGSALLSVAYLFRD